MSDDAAGWEEALIADLRANGRPTSGPLKDHPLLLMYSTGATSGERRRAILTYSRDGDAYVVAATAGGSARVPAWVANVAADPDVTIEIGTDPFDATASIVDDREHDRIWDQHVAELPWFAGYPEQAKRTIPVVRLTPRGG